MNSTTVQIFPSLALTLVPNNGSNSTNLAKVITDSKIQNLLEKANLTMVSNVSTNPSPFISTVGVGLQLLGVVLLGFACFQTYKNCKASKTTSEEPNSTSTLVETDPKKVEVDSIEKLISTHGEASLPESVAALAKAFSQYKEAVAKKPQDLQEIEQKATELMSAWDCYQKEKAQAEVAKDIAPSEDAEKQEPQEVSVCNN